MIRVRDKFILYGKMTALLCELFPDSVVTDCIRVNSVIYKKPDFEVERVLSCFSEPKERGIVIKKGVLQDKIDSIEFI